MLSCKKLKEKRNNETATGLMNPGPEGSSTVRSNLQLLVVDFQYVGDVEGSLLGTAGLLHELCIDVPR